MSLNLRWNRILQKQDSDLRFALNVVQDSLPTPSRIKEALESRAEAGLEDSSGSKSSLGKFTARCAQSCQASLLESVDD